MKLPVGNIAASLTLAVAAALVVAAREQFTNRAGSPLLELWIWPEMFDWSRLTLRLGYEYVGPPPAAVAGRALPRWILRALLFATGAKLSALNAWLQFACYWTGLEAVRAAARSFSRSNSMTAPALAALWLMWGFVVPGGFWSPEGPDSYPYDGPAFMFSALGLFLVLKKRFLPLFVVVVVGSMNKETTCWLVAAWLLSEGFSTAAVRRKSAETVLLGLGWFASVTLCRIGTAGALLFIDPQHNAGELLLLDSAGPERNVWFVLLFHVLAACNWKKLPRELRCVYPAALVHVGGLLFMGSMAEYRLWAEILPLGALSLGCLLEAGTAATNGTSTQATPCPPESRHGGA